MRTKLDDLRRKMWNYAFMPLEYESADMIIERTGIRFLSINGQPSAACIVSLEYENEERRTIDSVLSLD